MSERRPMAPDARECPAGGELFVLSAPSAAGKTSLIRTLFARHEELARRLAFSVSHTTRPPRHGEVAGKDYYFVSRREFEAMTAADRFLEWAVVYGELKGTSRDEVDGLLARGFDVLLDIDVQGAEQVFSRCPQALGVFILPPSYGELERRLRARGLDSEEQIERRLASARDEIQCATRYEYVILNDELERAAEALAGIFLARRSRLERMQGQIDSVLDSFPPS